MTYSIVIPSFNEDENLPRLLRSLETAQGKRDLEIIVIDNHSSDGTVTIAASAGVTVMTPPAKVRISELRNLGAERAKNDLLVFLDADMEVPSDFFDRLDTEFSKPGVDALGFVEDIPDIAPWFAKIWSRRTLARRADRRKTDFLPGRNICIRKSVFDSVGGFSTELQTSEDKDFIMRVAATGASTYTAPPIGLVHWGYEKTFPEWCRKEFWRQHSHFAMLSRHGLSLRLLRFPLLSLAHLACTLAILMASIIVDYRAIFVLPIVMTPGLGFALMKSESRKTAFDLISFMFLYALRFHIAGVAFLNEIKQHFITRRGYAA